MDYTTVDLVKAAIKATESGDDALFATLVTAASRAIDRKMTGAPFDEAENYFQQADVADEEIRGLVDTEGNLVCWPRKGSINSVSALAYRSSPLQSWQDVTVATYVEVDKRLVRAYLGLSRGTRIRVKISYNGGLATTQANLPADLIEAATVLAARFYREAESQLSDSIGVADLGLLVYRKSWPIRILDMLAPFQRVTPW